MFCDWKGRKSVLQKLVYFLLAELYDRCEDFARLLLKKKSIAVSNAETSSLVWILLADLVELLEWPLVPDAPVGKESGTMVSCSATGHRPGY